MLETPVVELLPQVLQWVNEQRAKQGRGPLKRMPKGVKGDPSYCPIANALNGEFEASVNSSSATFKDKKGFMHNIVLPPSCRSFIKRFDSGDIPKLFDSQLALKVRAERKVSQLESELRSYESVVNSHSDSYLEKRVETERDRYGDSSAERVRRQLDQALERYERVAKETKAKLVVARAELAKFS